MKLAVVAAVGVLLIQGSFATLLIEGPTEPILEGQTLRLECRYSNSEFNISMVHIEVLSKYSHRWYTLGKAGARWETLGLCFGPDIKRTTDSLIVSILYARRSYDGSYRCVSSATNVTTPDKSSQILNIKINYMGQLAMMREGYARYLGLSEELKVRAGDDVALQCSTSASEMPIYTWYKNGSDWILPSSKMTLTKVSPSDQGQYICMAKHPSVEVLKETRTIRITVLAEDAPWYATSHGQLMLMTSVVAAVLLVFIASVTVFLCRRAKATKGPIDDHSQKKPIYRTSVESLLPATADKQPLV